MLATLVLTGLESTLFAAENAAKAGEAKAPFGSLSEARETVTRVLRAANRANGRPSRAIVTSLTTTYDQLARSEKVPAADRRRLQERLRSRMVEQELALRAEKQAEGSLAGGVANDAEMLINLIQTTVSPESWEINGGRGSIVYFANR